MKKELKQIQFFALMAVSAMALFVSCDDDAPEVVDVTRPLITNVQHSEEVEPGGVLEITFDLSDDVALGEVRIDIHDDFDGHEHERVSKKAEPFTYENILDDMRGEKTFKVQELIQIPADASTGPYHLQIRFFDAAGNEGDFYVSTFEISSETLSPAITITNFEEGEELELDENGFLILEGSIQSQTEGGLEEVHIMVVHEEEGHSHGRLMKPNDEEPLYNREWELNGVPVFIFEEDIEPAIDLSGAAAGHYELIITARDMAGNVKVVSREIHVD